jgi:hypothetical protein
MYGMSLGSEEEFFRRIGQTPLKKIWRFDVAKML